MFQQLNRFLEEHIPYCAGKFAPVSASSGPVIDSLSLLENDGLAAAVAHFLDRQAGVDRRAALSVWSMYYFSHLAISPMVAWLVFRHPIRLAPGDLALRLDPQSGLPDMVLVRDPDASMAAATISDAFAPLVFDHAAPVIACFAQSGLSPRLMWSNLAVYIEWIAREVGNKVSADLAAEGLSLIEREKWPDGRSNPLYGLLARSQSDGGDFTRRRVCCLRYLLPDMPGCGIICPLPTGRTNSRPVWPTPEGPGIFPPGSKAIGSHVPPGMPVANRLCPDENLLRQNGSY